MTRRVIQTDLFAAFKESQKRAEEQLGQKRKIHVEGTAVRKTAETLPPTQDQGFEVIHSAPTRAPEGKPQGKMPQEAPEAKNPTTSPLAASTQAKKAPSPTTTAPSGDRVTISYQKAKRQSTVEAAGFESKDPEPRQRSIRTDTSLHTTRTTPTNDHSGTLLIIAFIIVIAAAAYIFGQKSAESQIVTIEKPVYYPAPQATEAVSDLPAETAVGPNAEVLPEENPEEVVESAPEPEVVVAEPQGKYSVLVVSGIYPEQAEKVAETIRNQSSYPVYIKDDEKYAAVYVGRFENFSQEEFNECQNFCQNIEFEERKQFRDAFKVNFPASLSE